MINEFTEKCKQIFLLTHSYTPFLPDRPYFIDEKNFRENPIGWGGYQSIDGASSENF
jgi:hypothetical protein